MTDLPDSLFGTAMRALQASRLAYAHYLHVLDAQRAAMRADDASLLSALAAEGSVILTTLDRGFRIPPELGQHLHRADGPRARAVRDAMAAVQREAETAKGGIDQFTFQLENRRRSLLGALAELTGGSPYRPPRPPPTELDTTG